jgi:hypothetical protein
MVTLFLGKHLMKFGVCCETVVGFDGEIRHALFVGVYRRSLHTGSIPIPFTLCRNCLLLLIVVAT